MNFKTLKEYPGYRFLEDGNILNERRGKNLSQRVNHKGYLTVDIFHVSGKLKHENVHKLIAWAFFGKRPESLCTCHNDGIKTNNSIGNLRYDTHKSNSDDMKKHGRRVFGERHGRSILNEVDVLKIREMRKNGVTYSKIAKEFGVTISAVAGATTGPNWSHL